MAAPLASCDYNSLLLTLHWHSPSVTRYKRRVWFYSRADFESLSECLSDLSFPSCLSDVDLMWSHWKDQFLSAACQFIPHCLTLIRRSLPWITKELIHKRDSVHRKAKSLNSMSAWSVYSTMRHKVVRALRLAKDNFLSKLSSSVRSSKDFWSKYHSLFPNHHHIPAMLFSGPACAESSPSKCELLNGFFSSIFLVLAPSSSSSDSPTLSALLQFSVFILL